MAIHNDNAEERQARLVLLVEQYRDTEQRRLLKRGIALWKRTEAERALFPDASKPPVEKRH